MLINMNQKIVEKIFLKYNLDKVKSVKKIEIGFTNKVYLIDNKFILKVCEDESNEEKFEMEVFLYNLFKNKIPVPKIKIFDNSKKIYNKIFMIYPKIKGDNLYSEWHLLSNNKRKNIIKQLCNILKTINKTPYYGFVNWHDKILNQIKNSLKKIKHKKLLPIKLIQIINKFVNNNHHVLYEQKLALVYWDAHFDNILIRNNKIVGILDFERTEVSSIDFILDIVKRMADYPKKYMSRKYEKFAKKEDYAKLLDWFKEFYPALFDFENLDKRLDLYAIGHDLDTLIWYPDSKEVKQMIAKTVNL